MTWAFSSKNLALNLHGECSMSPWWLDEKTSFEVGRSQKVLLETFDVVSRAHVHARMNTVASPNLFHSLCFIFLKNADSDPLTLFPYPLIHCELWLEKYYPCSSKCGLWTSSSSFWEPVRNLEPQDTPHIYWIRIFILTKPPGASCALESDRSPEPDIHCKRRMLETEEVFSVLFRHRCLGASC